MSTSLKTKSPRGTSGPDAEREELVLAEQVPEPETTLTPPPALSNEETITDVLPASSPDPAPAAGAAAESVKPDVTLPSPLSASDLKLARRMSRAIADSLGLSGKTRSVKI